MTIRPLTMVNRHPSSPMVRLWGICIFMFVLYGLPTAHSKGARGKARAHSVDSFQKVSEADYLEYYAEQGLGDPKNHSQLLLDPYSNEIRFPTCIESAPEWVLEDEIGRYIQMLLFPPLLLIGIVANMLSFPLLYSLSKSAWSTMRYLVLICALDCIVLLVRLGDDWFKTVYGFYASLMVGLQNSSDAACKTSIMGFNFVQHFIPWLLVAVAIETAIVTRWPHKAHIMCCLERLGNVILLMLIILTCLNVHVFWTWSAKPPAYFCTYEDEFSIAFQKAYWPIINQLVYLWLPLILVSLFTLITVTAMLKQKEDDKGGEMAKHFLELKTLKEFRNICVVLLLVFIVIHIFDAFKEIVQLLMARGYFTLSCYENGRYMIVTLFLKVILHTMVGLFSSCKFFLYMAMCTAFRQRVIQGWAGIVGAVQKTCCRCFGACCGWCKVKDEWTQVPTESSVGGEAGGSRAGVTEVSV